MTYRFVSVLVPLAMLSSFACANPDVMLSEQQMKKLGVATVALPNNSAAELPGLSAQVVVPSNQLVMMGAPLTALVEQTLVEAGEAVRKGQVMARLQSPAFVEAQRGFLQASVQAELARENLLRDEALFKDGIIAESRYRNSKGAAREAAAVVAERKQFLRASGMSGAALSKLQTGGEFFGSLDVVAPLDGVVLEKAITAGQRLEVATPLFKVAKLDPLALEIQVPLSIARGLRTGTAVTVDGFSAGGRLTVIGHNLSGGNQTVQVRAVINQGADNLRPGQFVEAVIAMPASTPAQWNVPNSALARLHQQAVIFVKTSGGFRAEAVTVIHEGAKNSVVSGALKGDEQIAVQGVSVLKSAAMGIGGGE
ncbi:MAG: efflux RND transporter periplasmic adaptor subunit [Pseudomonadota bacterium]